MKITTDGPAIIATESTPHSRSTGPKCRKCGVLPAERHGLCSGCSNYGD